MKRDLLVFCGGLFCGYLFFNLAYSDPSKSADIFKTKYKKLDLFATVLSYLENDYVDPMDGDSLITGAIKGMLQQLDPYTVYIPPKQYQEMKADTSGEYGGPGLEVSRNQDGQIIVISPIPDSPAAKAGIQAGDILVQIDKEPMRNKSSFEAHTLLRGRPGTTVLLWFLRPPASKPFRISLVREQIRVQSVQVLSLEEGYPLIRIKSFQDRTERQMKEALQALSEKKPIRGLLLDLRNNPGGLFDQSVRVADLFLRKGLIVSARGRNPSRVEQESAHEKGTWSDFPIVALINRGTASAAEIVAGALQDHRRALLLGQPSFGKGSVQTIIDLADGSGLKMTIARYYTPLGRQIHGNRLLPDLKVPSPRPHHADSQIKEALALLKNPTRYTSFLGKGLPAELQSKRP